MFILRPNKILFKSILPLLMIQVLSACNSSNVILIQDPWWYDYVMDHHDSVDVIQVQRSNMPSGEIELAITMKNNSVFQKQFVKYKVEWINVDGMPMKTILSRWNTISLLSNEIYAFEAVAPGSKASDFRITLKKEGRKQNYSGDFQND